MKDELDAVGCGFSRISSSDRLLLETLGARRKIEEKRRKKKRVEVEVNEAKGERWRDRLEKEGTRPELSSTNFIILATLLGNEIPEGWGLR